MEYSITSDSLYRPSSSSLPASHTDTLVAMVSNQPSHRLQYSAIASFAVTCILAAGFSPAIAQSHIPVETRRGATVKSESIREVTAADGTLVRYLWSGPSDGAAAQTVLLFAPGSGDEQTARRVQSLYWSSQFRDARWAVATPISPSGKQYYYSRPDLAVAVADDVILHSSARLGKHLVMGVSNGGVDALMFAATAPGRVQATTVFPGALDAGSIASQLAQFKDKTIVMFVGSEDAGWVQTASDTSATLRGAGARVTLKLVHGQGHVLTFSPVALFNLQSALSQNNNPQDLYSLVDACAGGNEAPTERAMQGAMGLQNISQPSSVQEPQPRTTHTIQPQVKLTPVPAAADDSRRREVGAVLDDFHDSAGKADEQRYFNHFLPDAVFFGTDVTERWTYAQFRAWAKPHFENGKGWKYTPRDRSIFFSPSGDCAWFDELVDNKKLGTCRGTGVLVLTDGVWRIAQYHLVLPVPNELAEELARQAAKLQGNK